MEKRSQAIRWLMIIVVLSFIWWWRQMPDTKLRLFFCDVGQGDATLIVWGSFQALIDTGPKGESLGRCLAQRMPFWDRGIELVIISHEQSDHFGALNWLRSRYKVGKIVTKATIGDSIRYKDLYFDIVWESEAGQKIGGYDNDGSNVVLVRRGEFRALFTGDITTRAELALVDGGVLKEVAVLKVPHHGSKYSSSVLFLEALKPKVAVISVGAKNTYGHPSSDTLMRLDGVGTRVARTDVSGTIEIEVDGQVLGMRTER